MSNKSLGKCVYCGNDLFSESVHACKPAYPNCGACSGDGAICKKSCKLADESPSLQINPEQEPKHVATVAEVHMSRYTIEWTNGPLPEGAKLYDAPQPKQPEQEPLSEEREFWLSVVDGLDKKPESPTQGMTLGQRISHVGGRENAAGYIEFGSPMAVKALIDHVLRDTTPPQRTWVGLTDEDIAVVLTGDASLGTRLDELTPSWIELVKAVEAKLKDKNT